MSRTKVCPICGRTLPFESFPAISGRSDGRHSYCKPCKRDYDRTNIMLKRAKK